MKILSRSPEQTREAGFRLGRTLKKGQTVCLYGELGAGKTVFVKGIARALGINERDITSASFTIISEHGSDPPLYHIDLYRIGGDEDLQSTGVYDFIGGDGIAVIEWADRMEVSDAIKVSIGFVEGEGREIVIEGADL